MKSAKGVESEYMAEGGGAGSVGGTGALRMDPMAEAVRVTRKLGRVDSVAFDVAQEKPSCLLGAGSGTGGETGSDVGGGAAECGSMGGAEGTEISDDDSTCSESGGAAESSDSSSSSDGAPTTVGEFCL